MATDDYGIKITVPGKSTASTDPNDYVLWSKYPIMKTYAVGTVSYTFPNDVTQVAITITHNLGERKVTWLSIDGSAQDASWVTTTEWAFVYLNGGDRAVRYWVIQSLANNFIIQYFEDVGFETGAGYDTTGEEWDFKFYFFIEELA